MAKAFCPECGASVEVGHRFCLSCGAKLPPEIAGAAAPAPTLPADAPAAVRESALVPEFTPPSALISRPATRQSPARQAHPDPSLSYFEDEKPRGAGLCSDNSCPCSETEIPKGTGYLYIPRDIVEFRRRYPRRQDAQAAMEARLNEQLNRQGIGTAFMSYRIGPTLVCEQGARLRKLELDVAGADARYWWETGQVPLRPTPLVGGEQQAGGGPDVMGIGLKPAQQPSNCFIATAACGSDQAEDVVRLREFRERVLRRSWLGQTLIATYELCSPPMAQIIRRWACSRWLVRTLVVRPLRRLADSRSRRFAEGSLTTTTRSMDHVQDISLSKM